MDANRSPRMSRRLNRGAGIAENTARERPLDESRTDRDTSGKPETLPRQNGPTDRIQENLPYECPPEYPSGNADALWERPEEMIQNTEKANERSPYECPPEYPSE